MRPPANTTDLSSADWTLDAAWLEQVSTAPYMPHALHVRLSSKATTITVAVTPRAMRVLERLLGDLRALGSYLEPCEQCPQNEIGTIVAGRYLTRYCKRCGTAGLPQPIGDVRADGGPGEDTGR